MNELQGDSEVMCGKETERELRGSSREGEELQALLKEEKMRFREVNCYQ